jgi:peptidyl-prolyl cis-trans isomerase B (cyclophilin B)
MIVLHTSAGDITIELDYENSPKSAKNFRRYAEIGYYEGTIFHRIIDNFMIQGGGFSVGMEKKKVANPIENEADNGVPNLKGTIAMARTTEPHSATAQFFINVADNDFLNHTAKNPQGWGYAVFGKITEGMDVIEAMKGVKTSSSGGHQDVPVEDIIINSVTVSPLAPEEDDDDEE